MLSQHLASQNQGLQLQGQHFTHSVLGLQNTQQASSTGLNQLTTASMLAACGNLAGLLNAASLNAAASSSPSLAQNNAAAVFTITPLVGVGLNNGSASVQPAAAEDPSSAATAAASGQHLAALPQHAAAPLQDSLHAAAGLLPQAGAVPHGHDSSSGALAVEAQQYQHQQQHQQQQDGTSSVFAAAAGPAAALQGSSDSLAGLAGPAFAAGSFMRELVGCSPQQSPQGHAAAAAAAAGIHSSTFFDTNSLFGTGSALDVTAGQATTAAPAAGTDAAAAVAGGLNPYSGAAAAAAAEGVGAAGSMGAFAAAGAAAASFNGVAAWDLERCPTDLVPVVCGQLHGWYSSSKDKILLLQQYSAADQQQQLQPIQTRAPPAAALASAWVTRPGNQGMVEGQGGNAIALEHSCCDLLLLHERWGNVI